MKYSKIDKNKLKVSINASENIVFKEDKDKYLFINKKTIGFRKDKKTEKFVGLRNGYSKQMEFSLLSILIDCNETIDSELFNDINTLDDVVIHKINDMEIYNKVDNSNYRNLIKLTKPCDNIEILYKINLNGLKILSREYKNGNEFGFLTNEFEQYYISDEGNNNIVFVIDKPIAFTLENKILNIVSHKLYKKDDIIYYKKTISSINYYLNNGFFTLPIFIDANIQYLDNKYFTLTKKIKKLELIDNAWSNFLNTFESGYFTKTLNDLNIIKIGNLNGNNTLTDVEVSRHFFNYNLSELYNYGNIEIIDSYFNFVSDGLLLDTPLYLQKSTYNGSSININNWNMIDNSKVYPIEGSSNSYTNTSCVFKIDETDIKDGNNIFLLRSKDDYEENPPITGLTYSFYSDYIKNSYLDLYFNISINDKKTLLFNLEDNESFATLKSDGNSYETAFSGSTISISHSSSTGTYEKAFGLEVDSNLTNYSLYRTYFTFNTNIISSYKDVIIRSVRLKLVSYLNRSQYLTIYVNKTNDLVNILNDNNSWNLKNSYQIISNPNDVETNRFPINYIGNDTIIKINNDLINVNGYTNFSVIDYFNDFLKNISSFRLTGIDFSRVVLEVDIEPYLINGVNKKQIISGEVFTLDASKNFIDLNYEIRWSDKYDFSNIIGVGDTISLNSNYYKNGDIIYAAIFKIDTNEIIKNNYLSVTLEIIEFEYDKLYYEKRGVYNVLSDDSGLKGLHIANIDNIYFIYQTGISGVCYSYARELENIYENNENVSDGVDIGAYNMYNEFDIIDEFYSNVKDVDVAVRADDIDLNKSYKELDGLILHQGTRVLLYSSTPSEKDGVYIADYNLKLKKTTETDSVESTFRYKLNVKFGTFLDYEFHTYYYDNIENIKTEDGVLDFEIFDASLYGDTIIDMGTYYDKIYDSNI